jgi:hypothetical protein
MGSNWLQEIRPGSAPDIGIFAFENKLASVEPISRNQVDRSGEDLFVAITKLQEEAVRILSSL